MAKDAYKEGSNRRPYLKVKKIRKPLIFNYPHLNSSLNFGILTDNRHGKINPDYFLFRKVRVDLEHLDLFS